MIRNHPSGADRPLASILRACGAVAAAAWVLALGDMGRVLWRNWQSLTEIPQTVLGVLATALLLNSAALLIPAGGLALWFRWPLARLERPLRVILILTIVVVDVGYLRNSWPGWPEWLRSKAPPPHLVNSPNIVLLTLDTTRRDQLGCYGNPDAYTPVLDEVSRRGVLVNGAATTIPRTGPAHATMLTGCFPHTHGSHANGRPIDANIPLMQEILRDRGYTAGAVVSGWTLKASQCGLQRGFHHYDDKFTPDTVLVDEAAQLLILRAYSRLGILPFHFWDTVERRAIPGVSRAVNWLAEHRRESFFLWLHLFDAHTPYFPHERYRELFTYAGERVKTQRGAILDTGRERSLYANELAYQDGALARLFRFMESSRMLRNLLLVVTADHGESLTEHGYFFEHGQNLYQQGIEIPMILMYPGRLASHTVLESTMSLPDLMPSVLSLAAVPTSVSVEGRNLAPALRDRVSPASAPQFMETTRESYTGAGLEGALEAVIAEDWKLIAPEGGPPELYDIQDDPRESVNRIESEPARAERLHKLLRDWRSTARHTQTAPELDPASRERLKALGYIR